MSTAHKLQDEWLLSYAAGALNPGRSLMVASHLAYHDDLQETVADAETIGGILLNSMEEAMAAHERKKIDDAFDRALGWNDENWAEDDPEVHPKEEDPSTEDLFCPECDGPVQQRVW